MSRACRNGISVLCLAVGLLLTFRGLLAQGTQDADLQKTATQKPASTQSLRVAMLLPLSGPRQAQGMQLLAGAEFASRAGSGSHLEWSSESRPRRGLRLLYEDLPCDPTAAEAAFDRVVIKEQAELLISFGCPIVQAALKRRSERLRLPLISLLAESAADTPQHYSYRYDFTREKELLAQCLGERSAVLLCPGEPGAPESSLESLLATHSIPTNAVLRLRGSDSMQEAAQFAALLTRTQKPHLLVDARCVREFSGVIGRLNALAEYSCMDSGLSTSVLLDAASLPDGMRVIKPAVHEGESLEKFRAAYVRSAEGVDPFLLALSFEVVRGLLEAMQDSIDVHEALRLYRQNGRHLEIKGEASSQRYTLEPRVIAVRDARWQISPSSEN